MATTNTRSFMQLAQAFTRIDADRSMVLHEAVALFGDAPTYEAYNAARVNIINGYKAERPLATDNACNVFFSRFMDAVREYAAQNEYALAIPKKPASESDTAKAKAAQRAMPEAIQNAKTVADLDAIPMPTDALEAAKLTKQIAETKVRMLKLEGKAAEKKLDEALKARREALIAFIRKASGEQLAELEAMKEHNVTVVLAALPATDVQKAAVKLVKLTTKGAKANASV